MQIADKTIKSILDRMPAGQRREIEMTLKGKHTHRILCLSEDIKQMQDVPVLDEKGEPVLYKTGKHKGEPKTEKKEVVVREGCYGRHIGNIISLGEGLRPQIRGTVDDQNRQFLRVHRFRMDGFIGFKCLCGQDSRIAEAEQGIFDYKGTIPDRSGMEQIFDRVRKRPPMYPIVAGKQIIDGFMLEEVK